MLVVLMLASVARASFIVAEPDAHLADTNISGAFDNATLSVPNAWPYPSDHDACIYSREAIDPAASTGTRVFASGRSDGYENHLWFVGHHPLRIEFAFPASDIIFITIDVIGAQTDPGYSFGAMLAYDAGGVEIAYAYTESIEARGDVSVLEMTNLPDNTSYILAGGWFGYDVCLDNLQVEYTPEPTMAMLVIAGLFAHWPRRRRV